MASDADAATLAVPVGAPLMRLESVGFGPGLEPVRYTDSLSRGDRFRFTTDSKGSAADLRFEVKAPDAGS